MKYIFDDFDDFSHITQSNLLEIIKDNRDTEFGKKYNFDKINSVDDYKKYVPISDYNDFDGYLNRIAEGETNVTTVYPRAQLLLSSGTTGERKKIFLSQKALSRYADYVYIMPYILLDCEDKYQSLHTNIFRTPDKNGTIISIAYFDYLKKCSYINDNTYVGGFDLLFNDNVENLAYIKAREALSCPQLFSIQSVFAHEILHVFQYLESNWQMIVSDIENDTFAVELVDDVKKALLKIPKPDREWIDFLKAELSKGFDTPIIPRVWKNVRFMVGIGGEMFKCQLVELKKYSGSIPLFNFVYALSECVAGVSVEFDKSEYAFLPKSGHYEFLPTNCSDTLSEKEIEIGKHYELVLTNFSGLYRYRTGDLIEITGFVGGSPKFKFAGRASQEINIAGEKVSASVMVATLNRVFDELHIKPTFYSIGIEVLHYALYIELDCPIPSEQIALKFDEVLRKNSPDYDDIRMLGNLHSPSVYYVKGGSHTECMEKLLPAVSQKKILLFLDEEKAEFLNERKISND